MAQHTIFLMPIIPYRSILINKLVVTPMHEDWRETGKPHKKSTLSYRQSLWEWCPFFVFNQCFYACNENGPAGRHKVYWTGLNCSPWSLATRHRPTVDKKAIRQSVNANSSNQWRLVWICNIEGTTRGETTKTGSWEEKEEDEEVDRNKEKRKGQHESRKQGEENTKGSKRRHKSRSNRMETMRRGYI